MRAARAAKVSATRAGSARLSNCWVRGLSAAPRAAGENEHNALVAEIKKTPAVRPARAAARRGTLHARDASCFFVASCASLGPRAQGRPQTHDLMRTCLEALDCKASASGDTLTGTVGAGAFGSFPLSGTRTA